MKRSIYLFIPVIIAACLVTCKPKDTAMGIITGETIKVHTQTIPVTGGQIKIDKPGDPLDKLTIAVPSNAFTTARDFNISYATIESHTLGVYFNPLTPLITITNGGGYSDSIITITIPVNVPEDHFAMAFFYNEKTGELEGMPLIASDSDKVVVITRTFNVSGGSVTKNGSPLGQIQNSNLNADGSSKIVVASAEKKKLEDDYDTGFKPGVDDCPFPNRNTIHSTKGIWSGQAVAMLWYYTEKKTKESPGLYKLLENDGGKATPSFWQDDTKGIKLASVVDNDYSYGALYHMASNVGQLFGQSLLPNRMTRYALLFAMKQTKQPQYIYMVADDLSGHAAVAYRYKDDKLYIADPNIPGDAYRYIAYDKSTHNFAGYINGGTGVSGHVKQDESFRHFWYMARASLVSYPTVEEHWKEVEKGTIGTGKFPELSIIAFINDNEYVPLTNGFTVPDGLLKINIEGGADLNYYMYDAKGKLLEYMPNTPVQLLTGEQLVGILATDKEGNWAGFKWVTVKVGDETAKVKGPMRGEPKFTYRVDGESFTADTGSFRIEGDRLYLSFPRFIDGIRNNMNFATLSFHGTGVYNDATAEFNEIKNGEVTGFSTAGKPGNITIIKWSEGRMNGTFSFTVSDIHSKGETRKIEGEFYFPR